jgi:hypothetical protein
MRKLSVLVSAVVLAIVLLPYCASAQSIDPPTCCWDDGKGPHSVAPGGSQAVGGFSNRIAISDESLRAMGMGRSDFVDRLAGTLFFGKNVDLIVTIDQPVPSRTRILRDYADKAGQSMAVEGILLSIQEKRVYQIPRARMSSSDIETLDHFSITDGQTYIEIVFGKAENSTATS